MVVQSDADAFYSAKYEGIHKMARRRFQQGLYLLDTRSDGSKHWVLRFWQDVPQSDGTVKRVRRKVTVGPKTEIPTKALAKKAGARYLDAENHTVQAVREGKNLDAGGFLRFEVLVEKWKENRLSYTSAGTHKVRWSHVTCWVLPAFQGTLIGDVTTEALQGFLRKIEKTAHLNANTIRGIRQTLNQIFKFAVDFGYLASNPAAGLKAPRYDAPDKKIFDVETFRNIFSTMAAGQNQDIIYLLAETGLRSGEMAGLMIDDLDFIKNTISIRRSVDRTLSLVGTPKTKASRRTLHGSPYLMNLLHSYVAGRSQGYVFHSKNHDWVTPDTVLYQFRLALRQVGLDPDSYNLHTLRHFNTSLMASIGIPLKIAKERLGHSVRGDITLGTYTHSFTDDEIGAAAKIHGALVGEPKSEGTMASDLAQDLRQLAAKHGLRIEDVVGRLTAVMDN